MAENTCTRSLYAMTGEIELAVESILSQQVVFWEKADVTPVSNIDIAIQTAIVGIINSRYAGDNFVLEEEEDTASLKSESAYTWVIDPIDGTANFISGKKEFGISIGLMKDDKFCEAYLLFPSSNETFFAGKNKGILKNNKPYFAEKGVNKQSDNEIILCSKTFPKLRVAFQQEGFNVSCYNCATYSLLMLLKGNALLYHTINTRLYDVGPMAFIVEKLGVYIIDYTKSSLTFRPGNGIIPFFLAITKIELLDKVLPLMQ